MTKNGRNIECKWCNFKGSPEEFEKHLKEEHFISYRTAAEISLLQKPGEEGICYKCGKGKNPLTFLIPDQYYIPCWKCLGSRERKAMTNSLLEEINSFYERILSDRYLQLFLIDPIYLESTIPHTYDVFKSVLSKKDLPSRNNIWFLDWIPGVSKSICLGNLQGINIKDLGELYNITSTKEKISVNKFSIAPPQVVKYDGIHHGRYNILNMNGDRKTKRLRIPGTDKCYKFWNNPEDSWKSILKVVKDGKEENAFDSLKPLDFLTLKLCLMRNKNYMRSIFQIISYILSQGVGVLKDEVFLKNTIDICSMDEKRKYTLNLSWTPKKNTEKKENTINISIL